MAKIDWEQWPSFIVWNKIKRLRKERGLSQTQVAAGAAISITTLWMIEQGYEKKTSNETKKKLANFFKCNIKDIFPAEMIGNKPKEEYLKNIQSQKD